MAAGNEEGWERESRDDLSLIPFSSPSPGYQWEFFPYCYSPPPLSPLWYFPPESNSFGSGDHLPVLSIPPRFRNSKVSIAMQRTILPYSQHSRQPPFYFLNPDYQFIHYLRKMGKDIIRCITLSQLDHPNRVTLTLRPSDILNFDVWSDLRPSDKYEFYNLSMKLNIITFNPSCVTLFRSLGLSCVRDFVYMESFEMKWPYTQWEDMWICDADLILGVRYKLCLICDCITWALVPEHCIHSFISNTRTASPSFFPFQCAWQEPGPESSKTDFFYFFRDFLCYVCDVELAKCGPSSDYYDACPLSSLSWWISSRPEQSSGKQGGPKYKLFCGDWMAVPFTGELTTECHPTDGNAVGDLGGGENATPLSGQNNHASENGQKNMSIPKNFIGDHEMENSHPRQVSRNTKKRRKQPCRKIKLEQFEDDHSVDHSSHNIYPETAARCVSCDPTWLMLSIQQDLTDLMDTVKYRSVSLIELQSNLARCSRVLYDLQTLDVQDCVYFELASSLHEMMRFKDIIIRSTALLNICPHYCSINPCLSELWVGLSYIALLNLHSSSDFFEILPNLNKFVGWYLFTAGTTILLLHPSCITRSPNLKTLNIQSMTDLSEFSCTRIGQEVSYNKKRLSSTIELLDIESHKGDRMSKKVKYDDGFTVDAVNTSLFFTSQTSPKQNRDTLPHYAALADVDNEANGDALAPLDVEAAASDGGENRISMRCSHTSEPREMNIATLEKDHDMAHFGEPATTDKGSLNDGQSVASSASNDAVIYGQMNGMALPSKNDHGMVPLDDKATGEGSSDDCRTCALEERNQNMTLRSEDTKDSPVKDRRGRASDKDNCQSLSFSQDHGIDPPGYKKTNHVLESGKVVQEAPANKGERRTRPTEQDIIPYLDRNMTMEATAKALDVSKSTLKRAWKGLNKGPWPSNKRHSAKKQKCNAESTSTALECGEKKQTVSLDKTTRSVKETERPSQDGGSSNLVVKAKYKEDTIKMVFACTPSFGELKEEVGKKLELDLNKFKIQYQDNENDCILMTCDSDLQDACDSSETNIVRLTILDK